MFNKEFMWNGREKYSSPTPKAGRLAFSENHDSLGA